MDENETSKYDTQDYYFPNSLIRPNNKRHDIFINYGRVSSVLIQSDIGQPVLNQNNHFNDDQLSAKHPTLPISSTALQVDYPFKDRVMAENLANIEKARYFVNYITRMRGAMLSKIPCNHLKPLKRLIEGVEEEGCIIKLAVKTRPTETVKNYILDYTKLISANIENYNSEYVGGCLAVLNDDRYNKTVCFPSVNEDDNNIYKYGNGIEIDIGSGIYEVQSTKIRDTGYCGIRSQDNKCHMMRFQGENYSNTINTIETVDEKPTSIAVSPYIEGESLIATDSGTVHIWNVGKGLEGVILNKATRFHCNDKWRQVQYGACPQEIVLADKTVVQIYDRRTKCDESFDLFTLPNKRLLNNERITVTSKHPSNPYQYLLATDYSLLLLDQRFPNHSVLYWDHLLDSSPGLISVYKDQYNTDNSLVLLSSHYPPETTCFRFQQSDTKPATSTQTPFRLSKISDICNYEIPMLNTYCILSKKRLETSLSGISALSGADSNSILTLQLDCHGELYHQVYSTTNNNNNDPTCSAGPGFNTSNFNQEAQLHCKLWMSSLERHVGQVCEENNLLEVTTIDYSNRYHEVLETGVSSESCVLCKPGNIRTNYGNNNIEELCDTCQLSPTTSHSLLTAHQQDKFASIDSDDGLKIFNEQIPPYDKLPHSTARSQILIKLWHEPEPDLSSLLFQADKDLKKYKDTYEKAKRKLIKKSETRRKYYTTLKKKGHDINKIYFEYKNNPKLLDRYMKSLIAGYDEGCQLDGSFITDTATYITDATSMVSKVSKPDANRTLLARESQNLSLLQMLQSSSSGTHSHTDQLSVHSGNSSTHTLSKSHGRRSRGNSISSQTITNHPSSPTNSEKSLNCSADGFKKPQATALKKKKSVTPDDKVTKSKKSELAEADNKSKKRKRKREEGGHDSDDLSSSSVTSDGDDLSETNSDSTGKTTSSKRSKKKKVTSSANKRRKKQNLDTESNLADLSSVEEKSTLNEKPYDAKKKSSKRESTKNTKKEKGKGDGEDEDSSDGSSQTDSAASQKASCSELDTEIDDEYTFHSDSSLRSNHQVKSKRKSTGRLLGSTETKTLKRKSVVRMISDSSSEKEKNMLSPQQSDSSRNISAPATKSNGKKNKHQKGRKKAKNVNNDSAVETDLTSDGDNQTTISSHLAKAHRDPDAVTVQKNNDSSYYDSESNESTCSKGRKRAKKKRGKSQGRALDSGCSTSSAHLTEALDKSTVDDFQTLDKTISQLSNSLNQSENYNSDASLFSTQPSVQSDVNSDSTTAQEPGASKKKKKKKKKKKNKSCLDSSQDSNRENSDDNDFSNTNSPNTRATFGSKTSTSKTEGKKSKARGERGKSHKKSKKLNGDNESLNDSDSVSFQNEVQYNTDLLDSDCNSFCEFEFESPKRLDSGQVKEEPEDYQSDLDSSLDHSRLSVDSVLCGEDDDKSSVHLSVSHNIDNMSDVSGNSRSVKEETTPQKEGPSLKIETDKESVKDLKYEVESINETEFDSNCLKRELEDNVESDISESKQENSMVHTENVPPSPNSVSSDVVHIANVCNHSIPISPASTLFSPISHISPLDGSDIGLENPNSNHKRNLFNTVNKENIKDSVKVSAVEQLDEDFKHNSINSPINQACDAFECNSPSKFKFFKPEITSTQLNTTILVKSSKKKKKKNNFVIGF
ncbi:hypothetical protein LOTGIDRAFT_233091 [Lottia gigantea]|uniref:TAF1C beta-propeller domain-containing protein n=1 Tax=Lottia gigantea TaxID=225164 RepID=V4AC28_LOTGI|nr:hypothetical protein LOTGIDRAFT_233091 [Lottia gigantea]ESO92660.1 hypothetical protein LOTGIDRAFT_233091 [Lottia gigantea]